VYAASTNANSSGLSASKIGFSSHGEGVADLCCEFLEFPDLMLEDFLLEPTNSKDGTFRSFGRLACLAAWDIGGDSVVGVVSEEELIGDKMG
jgi:hypothetical protein